MSYTDPIIAKLIGIFEAEGPKELKGRYYFGDPLQVPKSMLPACFITKDATDIHAASNAEDESEMSLVLNVVYDLTRDFNQASQSMLSSSTLYDVIEGRNEDYTLKPRSLAYLLRKHQSLGNQAWIAVRGGIAPDYGMRLEVRGPGIYTVEGVIKFTVLAHQLSPMLDSGTPADLYVTDDNTELYEAS